MVGKMPAKIYCQRYLQALRDEQTAKLKRNENPSHK